MKKTVLALAVLVTALALPAGVAVDQAKPAVLEIQKAKALMDAGKSIESEGIHDAALKNLRSLFKDGTEFTSSAGCEWQRISAKSLKATCLENLTIQLSEPGEAGSSFERTSRRDLMAFQAFNPDQKFQAAVRITVQDSSLRGARHTVVARDGKIIVFGQLKSFAP